MLRFVQIVTVLSVATQAVGFLRTAIIAYALGASPAVDAYYLGLIAPTLLSTVFSALLQSAFLGRYAGLVGTGELSAAAAYKTQMSIIVGLLSFSMAVICAAYPREILVHLIPAGQVAMVDAAAQALKLVAWSIIPLIVSDFLGLILNAHRRFLAAAAAPLVNAIVSVATLWLWPQPGVEALVITLLAGAFSQLLFIVGALWMLALPIRLVDPLVRGEVWKTLWISSPVLPAIFLANSAAAVIQFRMATIGEGAVSILGYASRMHAAVSQILVLGLSTVLLPHLAQLWARSDNIEIERLYRRLIRISILLTVAVTVGVALMGSDVIRILLGRGRMGPEDADKIGAMWFVLSLGLMPMAIGTFIAKLAQARRATTAILLSGIVSFAAAWALSYYGAFRQDAYLIGLSSGAAFCLTLLFWLAWISRGVASLSLGGEILQALWRAGIILMPSIILDMAITNYGNAVPEFLILAFRCIIFCAVAGVTCISLGQQRWFLNRKPR